MQNTLVQSLIRGTPQDKVVKDFAKKMNTSLNQAGRLIATETAYFTTQGEFDSLNNLDVKQYEILATLDRRTSDICRHLDGKIFNMSDKQIGITAPPFHCWCRSCIIPHTPKLKGSKRAARNDEGKTYYIDGNMKYNDWKKVFVDKTMTFEEWKNKRKDSIIKEKIEQVAKKNKIKFEQVKYPPQKLEIPLEDLSFDDNHINKERLHAVTRKEAEKLINEALCTLIRWKGQYYCYMGSNGSVYIDIGKKLIRTSYKREQYDDNTLNFIKGVEEICH